MSHRKYHKTQTFKLMPYKIRCAKEKEIAKRGIIKLCYTLVPPRYMYFSVSNYNKYMKQKLYDVPENRIERRYLIELKTMREGATLSLLIL